MTALDEYAKLEAEARYFDGQSASPREVILSFGARTLVIVTLQDEPIAHWPLASLHGLGDPEDAVLQLAPDPDADERIVLDDSEMIAAIKRVCPDLLQTPVPRRNLRRVFVWGGAALAALALIVMVLIPALADRLADYVPPERERALGKAVARNLGNLLALENGVAPALCTDRDGVAALERLALRIGEPQGLAYPLRVSVIDSPMINALALPGGRILIFNGLIQAAQSPEEVAGVLAHEIGHVVYRDPTRGVLRAAGTAGIAGIMLGDVFGASVLAAASDAVVNARHQRLAEQRADETAYGLLRQAGLPARPLSDFFARLHRVGARPEGPLQLIASHPAPEGRASRAAAADTIGEGAFVPALGDRDWLALRNICDTTRVLDGCRRSVRVVARHRPMSLFRLSTMCSLAWTANSPAGGCASNDLHAHFST